MARQSAGAKCGQVSGHEQPAVLGEPGQQDVGEVARGRLPAGGDVAHGGGTLARDRLRRNRQRA